MTTSYVCRLDVDDMASIGVYNVTHDDLYTLEIVGDALHVRYSDMEQGMVVDLASIPPHISRVISDHGGSVLANVVDDEYWYQR